MIRLGTEEIRVNTELQWPIYDQRGRLLLNQGEVVPSAHALQILLERGLYRELTADEQQREAPVAEQRINPFEALNDCFPRLQQFLANVRTAKEGSAERLRKLARDLQQLCELDADAALGAIHLAQDHCYSQRHVIHTAILCELMGKRLEFIPEHRETMIAAALTANIAMMELQDRLSQQKEPLSEQQRHQISLHPIRGVELLEMAGISDPLWLQIVRQHHERIDGTGYSEGLEGDAIIEEAKILAIADIYSAMVTPRAYRSKLQAKEALREMFMARGKCINEQLCSAFIREMGIYPPGSFVRLVNGEVAVVIRRSQDSKTPLVSSVLSPRGGAYMKPLRRETSVKEYAIKEFCAEEKGLKLNLSLIWGYSELVTSQS